MLTLLGYGGMQLGREERRTGLEAALRALARRRDPGADRRGPRARDVVNEAFARLHERGVQGKLLLDLS